MTTQWINQVLNLYNKGIAHSFVLHFNTSDYVSPEIPLSPVTYLSKQFAGRGEDYIVIVYSRDKGIVFPLPTMKEKAMKVLGLNQQPQQTNPALAALQATGKAQPTQEQELPKNPSQALPLIDKLLRSTRNVVVLVENTEFIIPDGPLNSMSPDDRTSLALMSRWGRDSEIAGLNNMIFLFTGNLASIHQDMRNASNRYKAIEISLPDTQVRREFIRRYIQKSKEEGSEIKLDKGLTVEMAANSMAGLSLLHIEDVLLWASQEGRLTQAIIWEQKKSIIKSEFGDVLEVMEPKFGFEDIGGLEYIKEFFIRSIINPINNGRYSRVPMGILMMGPAGTGKSIFAQAVAKESGINCVFLRIGGNIASKWQGEGERNLERALRAIAGLSPSICFIDEIDQAVQRGNGEGGNQQDQRIFQRLLEFMSDETHRGQVVFLAATNRPDLMDAALKRPGRFDKKIAFLIPTETEREAVFKVGARKHLGQDCEIPRAAIEATRNWTGAEIIAATVKAAELAEDYNLDPCQAIERAAKTLRPSTADIELMTYLALRESSDPDLLPPGYESVMDNKAELDSKIDALQEGATRTARNLSF